LPIRGQIGEKKAGYLNGKEFEPAGLRSFEPSLLSGMNRALGRYLQIGVNYDDVVPWNLIRDVGQNIFS